ncbi:MAG: autotransporter outer membrane beta-barrel domain-containing protein [Rhabdochlamydiaceae bacterium]
MKQVMTTTLAGLIVTCSLSGLQADVPVVKITDEGKQVFLLQTSKRDRFYWGPDIFWTNESPQIKGIHMKDNSIYYGLKLGYDFLRPNAIYAGVHALYAIGRMHIKAEADKTKIYQDRVNGSFANAELRGGYNFHGGRSLFFTPFLGLGGYHVRPTQSIHYVQNWLYGAMGMKADYEITSDFNIGLNIKGTRALYLEQRIKKNKYSATYHNNSNALGYEISLPLTLRMGHAGAWDLRLEPYYLKLNSHSDSSVVGGQLSFSARY